jgi:hypothetical protein
LKKVNTENFNVMITPVKIPKNSTLQY